MTVRIMPKALRRHEPRELYFNMLAVIRPRTFYNVGLRTFSSRLGSHSAIPAYSDRRSDRYPPMPTVWECIARATPTSSSTIRTRTVRDNLSHSLKNVSLDWQRDPLYSSVTRNPNLITIKLQRTVILTARNISVLLFKFIYH